MVTDLKHLALLCMILPTTAMADFMLQTVDLSQYDKVAETYTPIAHERFIAYTDCRDRGYKNLDLIKAMGGRGGFVCIDMDEKANAKEDTTIWTVPGMDYGEILRVYPIRVTGEIQQVPTKVRMY